MIFGTDIHLVCPACEEPFMLHRLRGGRGPCPICGAMLERRRERNFLIVLVFLVACAMTVSIMTSVSFAVVAVFGLPLPFVAAAAAKPHRSRRYASVYCPDCHFDLRTVIEQGGHVCGDCGAAIPDAAARVFADSPPARSSS